MDDDCTFYDKTDRARETQAIPHELHPRSNRLLSMGLFNNSLHTRRFLDLSLPMGARGQALSQLRVARNWQDRRWLVKVVRQLPILR